MSVQKRIKKKVASTLGIGTKNKVGKVRHQIRKGLTDVAKNTVSAGKKVGKKIAPKVKKAASAYGKGIKTTAKAVKKVAKNVPYDVRVLKPKRSKKK